MWVVRKGQIWEVHHYFHGNWILIKRKRNEIESECWKDIMMLQVGKGRIWEVHHNFHDHDHEIES